ncbi:hypothetical protein QM012_005857 [Aureobasidium pullulans]|uniref:Uncharacterized protein n=1 Tax=Aureobasidium pullulans TaxID=5580 RepID=A0ABR0TRG2_AURPU
MANSSTLDQLWANWHPLAYDELLEYKQLWDSMPTRCVTTCQISWFKVGTHEPLMTKMLENDFMLVATYLLETVTTLAWLKRGVPDLSALDEADKYLTFLQTCVRVIPLVLHDTSGIAGLVQTSEIPSDTRGHHFSVHEANSSIQHVVQMCLAEELRSASTKSAIPRHSAILIAVPGPEYTDSSGEFFPVDRSSCPSSLSADHQEKWTCMAKAFTNRPYLMHMHCPKTGARLVTLKFTSALALMTAYLESFSGHPENWWYFDEFMRYYLDVGDVDPQPTLDYLRDFISHDKPVVLAIPITE